MQVFISYAKSDRDWALKLSNYLKESGLEVWIDAANLFPGDNWALETGRALEICDAMVVLVSPEALQSERVRSEWQYALGNERFQGRLIPVLVRPAVEIPWILKTLQWIEGEPRAVSDRIAQVLSQTSSSQDFEARAGSH